MSVQRLNLKSYSIPTSNFTICTQNGNEWNDDGGTFFSKFLRPEISSSLITSATLTGVNRHLVIDSGNIINSDETSWNNSNVPITIKHIPNIDSTSNYIIEVGQLNHTNLSALYYTPSITLSTNIFSNDTSTSYDDYSLNVTLGIINDINNYISNNYSNNYKRSLFKIQTSHILKGSSFTLLNPLYYASVTVPILSNTLYSGKNVSTPILNITHNSPIAERENIVYPVAEKVQTDNGGSYIGAEHGRIIWKFNLPLINGNISYAYLRLRNTSVTKLLPFSNIYTLKNFKVYTTSTNDWTSGDTYDPGDFESIFSGMSYLTTSADRTMYESSEEFYFDVKGYPNHPNTTLAAAKGIEWYYDNSIFEMSIMIADDFTNYDDRTDDVIQPSAYYPANNGVIQLFNSGITDKIFINGMDSSAIPELILGINTPIIHTDTTSVIKYVQASDTSTSPDYVTITNTGAGLLTFTNDATNVPWIESVSFDTSSPLAADESTVMTINYDLSAGYTQGEYNDVFRLMSPDVPNTVFIYTTLIVLDFQEPYITVDSSSISTLNLTLYPTDSSTYNFDVVHPDQFQIVDYNTIENSSTLHPYSIDWLDIAFVSETGDKYQDNITTYQMTFDFSAFQYNHTYSALISLPDTSSGIVYDTLQLNITYKPVTRPWNATMSTIII